MTGLLVLILALGTATGLGVWLRTREGRIREEPRPVSDNAPSVALEAAEPPDHGGEVLTAEVLGTDLGARATMVQFSSPFCQPCKATKLILQDVSETLPGVAQIEINAETNLDLVRSLGIRRTPTVLILDQSGAIRKRAVGQPRKLDLLAAVAAVV